MKVESAQRGIVHRGSLSPAPSDPPLPRDTFVRNELPPIVPSADRMAMVRAGLPLAPEALGLQELQGVAKQAGLEKAWPELEKAYRFAETAHQGQLRDDGSPYIFHASRTARNAIEQFGIKDPEVLTAALLHDVVEDTDITPQQLEKLFGARTASMVSLLSKPDKRPDESYDQRNARYIEQLESFGSPDLVALKLADRFDNIDDTHLMPDRSKVQRYLQDTRDHYVTLADRHFPDAARQLEGKVQRIENWLRSTPG